MAVSRAVRRRLARLQPDVDRVVDGDVRFFRRHPHRSFRIRVASHAELSQYRAMERDDVAEMRPGCSWYILVRQIEPGVRIRVPAQGPKHHDVDLDEGTVRRLWEQVVSPGSPQAEVERRMVLATAKGSVSS